MVSSRIRDGNRVDDRVEGRTASITGNNDDINESDVNQQVDQRVHRDEIGNIALLQRLNELQARVERLEKEAEDRKNSQSRSVTQSSINRFKEEKEEEMGESQRIVEKRRLEGLIGPNKKVKENFKQEKSFEKGAGCEKSETGVGSSASVVKGTKKCGPCGSSHAGECSFATRRCFKCGKLGHMTNECAVKGNLCFNCHKVGHISRNCPQKDTGGRKEEACALQIDNIEN